MPMAAHSTEPRERNWRVELDRAWRSPTVRRNFETQCDIAPLSETQAGLEEQALSGHAQRYHHDFQVWATKYLGLETWAPPAIRQELASRR